MQEKRVMPLVSVVIPCYNAAAYIQETVGSVTHQTYPEIEILVVDDGSTDNSAAIVRDLQAKHSNLKYIVQQNGGVSSARNTGIRNAGGIFIALLDADDWMYPANISEKVNALLDQHADVAYSSIEVCDEVLRPKMINPVADPDRIADEVFRFSPPPIQTPSSVVARKTALEEAGLFDTSLSTSADLDMWIRLSFKYKFARVNQPLIKYRLVPGSMNTNIPRQVKDMEFIFDKYAGDKSLRKRMAGLKKAFYYSIVGNGLHTRNLFRMIKYGIKYFRVSFFGK